MATERYQLAGLRIDGYAESTDKYQNIESALRVLLTDCSFVIPDSARAQIPFPGA
jgi:hypothetical protein